MSSKRRSDTHLLDRGGQILAGRYRVIELLGVGAMGSVWIAEQMALRQEVVVKFHEEGFVGQGSEIALKRFMREARTLASVKHRNVTELFEVGRGESGEPYLIMERLRGCTLAARLRDSGTLPTEEALAIGIEVASGLEAVHAAGILHRDVKPENTFLHEDTFGSTCKLLDFGLARGEAGRRITEGGKAVGTPGYMAPEQARGLEDLDLRVDLYALGVMIYELLAGRLPSEGETMLDHMVWTVNREPTPLAELRPDLPSEVVQTVMGALARDRDGRYPNARAMRAALHEALESLDRPAATARRVLESDPPSKPRGGARHPTAADDRFDDLVLGRKPDRRTPPV